MFWKQLGTGEVAKTHGIWLRFRDMASVELGSGATHCHIFCAAINHYMSKL